VAGAAVVSAHSIFTEMYDSTGTTFGKLNCLRLPSYDGPIIDLASAAMTCNGYPNVLDTVSNNVCTIAAGSSLGMRWSHTLASHPGDAIDPTHLGPVLVYMAKVDDAANGTPPTTGWFKIYEDGLANGKWGTERIMANGGLMSVTIPACIPAGHYLIRSEIIALHLAKTNQGAQLYMECGNLEVTGGGSQTPDTSSIPGIYQASDPGILLDIYSGITSYTIPGPALFTCKTNTARDL